MILRDDCEAIVWFNPGQELGTTWLLTMLPILHGGLGERIRKK